eukprot:COSAG01_NODE_64598_length_276_cov_0.570621_1_plen_56_part_01
MASRGEAERAHWGGLVALAKKSGEKTEKRPPPSGSPHSPLWSHRCPKRARSRHERV